MPFFLTQRDGSDGGFPVRRHRSTRARCHPKIKNVIEADDLWTFFLPLLNWMKGSWDDTVRGLETLAAIEMIVKEEYRYGPRSKPLAFYRQFFYHDG